MRTLVMMLGIFTSARVKFEKCSEALTHQADELSSRPCCMNTTGPLPTILYNDTLTTWINNRGKDLHFLILFVNICQSKFLTNLYKVRIYPSGVITL